MNKEKFFDRKSYLELLEKRVRGIKDNYRQNLAIIGDEYIGKTSLIFNFLDSFCDTRIITVYLEVRQEALGLFVRRFIGAMLYNFLNNSGIPLKEDLGFLIEKADRFAPRTVEKIKFILTSTERRKKINVFSDLLTTCETLYQETGKSTVVIFDEFHNLEGLGIKNLYKEWSRLLLSQKHTMYIIVSSLKHKTKYILSKNLSLLFGNFEVVALDPFDIPASEMFLESRLSSLNLSASQKNFLVHFTGGFPLYLEVICDALLKAGSLNFADVLENLLFDSSGILNQKFSNYLKRFQDLTSGKDYIDILHLIASGKNRLKDIAHTLKGTRKESNSKINHLLELDTVTRSADFLKINDRVFGFWLKFVYQEKLRSFTFDAANQKEKFRGCIQNMIKEFSFSAERPMVERLMQLLCLFENDMIQVEKKKIRLNHFREVKHLEFKGLNLREGLIGRSQDSLWIMGFKKDTLNENDIAAFSRECRKYRHKLQRKVIVTLQDIDANTRLRAMEEKIWTWDLNSLNQLMDLFSKPWVVK